MKVKNYFLFTLAGIIQVEIINAQCIETFQYPFSTVTVNSAFSTTISTCNYAGDYATVNFTGTGVYSISVIGGTGNYITFTDAANNPLFFGTAPLTVTVSTAGIYNIHFSLDASCNDESVCRTTIVTPYSYTPPPSGACINTNQYPPSTIPVSSTNTTQISICNFAGEYAVTDFTATGGYTIDATGGSGNYITFTDAANNPLFFGTAPLTVTVSTTGIYHIHFSVDASCAFESSCRVTMITPGGWTPPSPPSNDDCINAIALTVPGTYTGSTIAATTETNSIPVCAITPLSQPGVWYSVTGDGSLFKASLCNTSWDSKLFVYTGNCSSLTIVGCNDDDGTDCSGTPSSIGWCTSPGTTYYILVTGFSTANDFTLSVDSYSLPYYYTSINSSTPSCYGNPSNSATISINTYPVDNSVWNFTIVPSYSTFSSPVNSVVVNPTISTNYTLSGVNSTYFNCSTNITYTLWAMVNPSPTITVNSATICSGQSAVLSASGAVSYSWNTGATDYSISVNPSTTTIYTVTAINSYSCSVSETATVNVLPNPSLSVTISDATAPGCSNGSATIQVSNGSSPYTYSWSPNVSTNPIANNLSSNNTYTVLVIDSQGCSASITFSVDCVTHISSSGEINKEITVWPNPTSGLFTINQHLNGISKYQIIDITGRIIKEFTSELDSVIIDITDVAKGLYIIKITNKEETLQVSIIKQ